jgi:hypothetical protein
LIDEILDEIREFAGKKHAFVWKAKETGTWFEVRGQEVRNRISEWMRQLRDKKEKAAEKQAKAPKKGKTRRGTSRVSMNSQFVSAFDISLTKLFSLSCL